MNSVYFGVRGIKSLLYFAERVMLEMGRGGYRRTVIRVYLEANQDAIQRVSGLEQAKRRGSRCAVYFHAVSVREKFDELNTVHPVLRNVGTVDLQGRKAEIFCFSVVCR